MKFLLLSLLHLCSACAALGTYAKIYPGAPASQLKTVGFAIPIIPHYQHSPYMRAVDSVFVSQLAEKLQAATGRPVQFVGRLRADRLDKALIDSVIATNRNVDAIAFCALVFQASDTSLTASSANAKVKIHFVKTYERAILGEFRFNTRLGKSYWLNPPVAVAIADATRGATAPLKKYFTATK